MSLTVITPNTNPVIELSEMKAHLFLIDGEDDVELLNKINEVKTLAENFTHRYLLNTTAEYALDTFPVNSRELWLPAPPLQSVTSVE